MVNSRTKGATAERAIVKTLRESLGDIVEAETLKRNLTQYQQKDCTDIIVGELFAVEVKHYKSGNWYREDWWQQACRSATLLRMVPVLAWRYDRQPFRWTMPIYSLDREYALIDDDHDFPRDGNGMAPITMDTDTAMMVMREWL